MRLYIKKGTALVCCCMAAMVLSACSGGQGLSNSVNENEEASGAGITEEEKAAAWVKYADTPLELQWYVNFSWFDTGWGENLVSQRITEETGISIRFITPAGNETEKINSMIASDTLPDLITLGWWENQAQQMIEKDMVYALNELAEEYDPYFFQVVDQDTMDWYTKEDGNIYGYPNSSFTPKDYEVNENLGSNQVFLVRKDIYEAIGSPDMTTTGGFANAVRKAVREFPTVNGYPLIPIGAEEFQKEGCNSFGKYLQNFLAVPFEENGKFYDRMSDPEYVKWLKMFRKLGQEGYLVNDIFIDRRSQIEEKIAAGRYFCMLYQGQDMLDQQKILYKRDPNSVYIAVDGPKNSDKDDPTLPGTGINGWTLTFISKNCKNPERAIAFLSYLMSERGQKLIYLGVEGETYDVVDGKEVIRPEVLQILNTDREEYDRIYGADDAYWMLQDNVMQLQWPAQISEAERQIKEWTFPYTFYAGQYEISFEAGTREAQINSKVEEEWGYTLPKLLLAESEEEFDAVMEDFLQKRDTYGYDRVMAANTEQMKILKKKLGLDQ